MTDKQIIIDGVDVSGCKYWKGYCRIASLCDYAGHLCEVTPNCYYKQLKRKEQECEEWQKEVERIQFIGSYGILDEVKKNEELEEQLDQLKTELEQEKALKETYLACYKAKHEDIEGELFKLSKTLTEIKEIAENSINCSYELSSVINEMYEIKEKISEVIE